MKLAREVIRGLFSDATELVLGVRFFRYMKQKIW